MVIEIIDGREWERLKIVGTEPEAQAFAEKQADNFGNSRIVPTPDGKFAIFVPRWSNDNLDITLLGA